MAVLPVARAMNLMKSCTNLGGVRWIGTDDRAGVPSELSGRDLRTQNCTESNGRGGTGRM